MNCENTDTHLEFFDYFSLKIPHETAPAFMRLLVSRLMISFYVEIRLIVPIPEESLQA
jgi:hypothetical protein